MSKGNNYVPGVDIKTNDSDAFWIPIDHRTHSRKKNLQSNNYITALALCAISLYYMFVYDNSPLLHVLHLNWCIIILLGLTFPI